MQEMQNQQFVQDEGMEVDEDDNEDVIDIDNPEDLARRGLQRVHDESEDQEYLLDQEGNLFNLQGEYIGKVPDQGDELSASDGF